jgi:hypothetical protein
VHPLSVNERDEANRAEDQATKQIRAAENWHAVFRANSAPENFGIDPRRGALPRFFLENVNRGTTWLRNFSELKVPIT